MLIDSVYRKNKNYYSQVFLGNYKCLVIGKKKPNFNDDIETYSNDSYNEYYDEECYDILIILMKKILMKKFK